MATKVTEGQSFTDYADRILSGKQPKLVEYIRGKAWRLPAPYNHRTNKKESAILAETKRIVGMEPMCFWRRIEGGGKIMGDRIIPSSMVGMPDIVMIFKGIFWGIELKASGGSVSCEQMATLKSMQRSGGQALIVVEPARLWSYVRGEIEATCDINGIDIL